MNDWGASEDCFGFRPSGIGAVPLIKCEIVPWLYKAIDFCSKARNRGSSCEHVSGKAFLGSESSSIHSAEDEGAVLQKDFAQLGDC